MYRLWLLLQRSNDLLLGPSKFVQLSKGVHPHLNTLLPHGTFNLTESADSLHAGRGVAHRVPAPVGICSAPQCD